jgi:hypothetical protein
MLRNQVIEESLRRKLYLEDPLNTIPDSTKFDVHVIFNSRNELNQVWQEILNTLGIVFITAPSRVDVNSEQLLTGLRIKDADIARNLQEYGQTVQEFKKEFVNVSISATKLTLIDAIGFEPLPKGIISTITEIMRNNVYTVKRIEEMQQVFEL